MQIQNNASLTDYSTMRLGGTARYMTEVYSEQDIADAADWAAEHGTDIIMVGGGSNIVWRDEGFDGLLVVNKLTGYDDDLRPDGHYVSIASGENWDMAVERTVQAGLTGIEALSLIPGTTGATPVQNVGAYGQEIADTLVRVRAYDLQVRDFVDILAADCAFGYRTSRFKTIDRGRFLITSITLKLQKANPEPPFYRAVATYFEEHGITDFTPLAVRDAVIDIRSHKLPDPAIVANNGSFFANPIVDTAALARLLAEYPDIPNWPLTPASWGAKIPAAWLIEQAGFKDYHDTDPQTGTGMATWPMQPLVLVNEAARSTADLLTFKKKIVDAVQAKFGIALEQEPELLPHMPSGS